MNLQQHVTFSQFRKMLGGAGPQHPRWLEHRAIFDRTAVLVQVFYAVFLYLFYDWSREITHLHGSLDSYDLLWPVRWIAHVGVFEGGRAIAQFGLLAGVAGLIGWRFLAVRILVSAALLQHAALSSSEGAISHGYHELIWVSVCFWFLPNGRLSAIRASRVLRMRFMAAFGLAAAMILVFYTLSGCYKTYFAVMAMVNGQTGGFSPDAMAITVAWRALQVGSQPMWANPIIDHPIVGWPLYMGLYYCEIASVFVIFRPRLYMIWGVVLIGFHLGTLLFMDIPFAPHVLINALLFVMSPFAVPAKHWREVAGDVPLFGWGFRLLSTPSSRGRAVSAPDSVRT